ncbi:MAG: LPS-assembly protein LptD [Pseudohongiellaceae bacterium]
MNMIFMGCALKRPFHFSMVLALVGSCLSSGLSAQTTDESEDVAEPLTAAALLESRPVYPLDWVPREEMTVAEQEALPANCCGAFIDPLATPELAVPDNPDIQIDAPGGLSQLGPGQFMVDGDITVIQGSRIIRNDNQTSIDSNNDTVSLEGNVMVREPGLLLEGSAARVDNAAGINQVDKVRYVLHNYSIHGEAASIIYNSESGRVSIDNGAYSRCEPGREFWQLRARSIVLNQATGRAYATAPSLRVGDVPVFYYPGTLPFPLGNQRLSGLLPPSIGSTRSGGFDFELPYYFNLAPHYDATLSPRLISDRGVLTSTEFRYLASWSMNTVNMTYMDNDKLYDIGNTITMDAGNTNQIDTNQPPGSEQHISKRWLIDYQHTGTLGSNWSTFVDYNAVSDTNYFHDLGSSGLNVASQTHLNRQARLDFNTSWLSVGVNVQRVQVIDPLLYASTLEAAANKPYDRLPQLHLHTNTKLPGGFQLGLSGQYSIFDRELDELSVPGQPPANLSLANVAGINVTGRRLNVQPFLAWSAETPGWFLRSRASYKHTAYKLKQQPAMTRDNPNIGAAVYSADAGLIFERTRRGGGRQTLEPRIFYLHSEYEDQSLLPLFDTAELNFSFNQLFRDDRFAGGDRIGDAKQLSVALSTRLLNNAGREQARFSLGQIRYFEDRRVSLNNSLLLQPSRYSPLAGESALVGELVWQPGRHWRLSGDVQWNQDNRKADEGSFQLRYQRDADRLFNLAYRHHTPAHRASFINIPPATSTGNNLAHIPLTSADAQSGDAAAEMDERIRQTDVSMAWPLTASWRVLARWNYDHSNHRTLEGFAGVEYKNCCATIRVIGREWVDRNQLFTSGIEPRRGFFVQFTLHGLGDLAGGGLSRLLGDQIQGFNPDIPPERTR